MLRVSASLFGPVRPHRGVSGHEWIQKQLDLAPEEQKALVPIETKFGQHQAER
jgi:hypothetical protein